MRKLIVASLLGMAGASFADVIPPPKTKTLELSGSAAHELFASLDGEFVTKNNIKSQSEKKFAKTFESKDKKTQIKCEVTQNAEGAVVLEKTGCVISQNP